MPLRHITLAFGLGFLVPVASAQFSYVPDYVNQSSHGVLAGAFAREWNTYSGRNGAYDHPENDGGVDADLASVSAKAGAASATAYGSLNTGAMHLGAATSRPADPDMHHAEAQASVDIWETVTLDWGTSNVRQFPLRVQFDGHRLNDGHSSFWYSGVSGFSGPFADQDMVQIDDTIFAPSISDPVRTTTFKVYAHAFASARTFDSPFEQDAPYTHGEPASADYTRTLKFMWDLPEGVTFTSASGAFKPQPLTQPVPEPAAFAPLGLGALALLKRRRK